MKDLTQGPIPKHIVSMSIPMGIGMLLQTLYYFVDLYFIARLGESALAGASAAGNVMMFVFALTQTLGVGTGALVSHAVGRKDRDDANLLFNQAVSLAGLMVAVTLVFGYALAWPYMRAIGADEPTIEAGVTFLLWFIPGLALQYPMVVMGAGLRATGIVKPTMVVQMVTVVLNAILAPVFIAGWGTGHAMGVAGAGLATSVATLAGNVVLAIYFVRLEKYVTFNRAQWKPRVDKWKALLKVGVPAGGEFAAMGLFTVTVYWITGAFGAAAQAGFGIGSRIMQMVFLPAMAVAFAAAPIAGQNFGARSFGRVRETFRSAAIGSCLLMAIITLFCQVEGEAMARIFSQDPAVVGVTIGFLHVISLNFVAVGLIFTCSALFQAMGNTWPSFLSMGVRLVTFAVPAIWLSRHPGFQLHHLWYISMVTVVIQAALSLWLLQGQFRARLR
ncbi:MATE family efflux transporter [Betaproteobacteria bacterium GR16-43]|nr:MATE family efflux transporter [Betaproteobacteria bacterium GR16-43]